MIVILAEVGERFAGSTNQNANPQTAPTASRAA